MGTESACGFSVSLSGDLAGGGGFLQSAYCGGIPGGIGLCRADYPGHEAVRAGGTVLGWCGA